MRVFDLSELSLKFERRLDCEAVDFKVLSDDYSKLVFLQVHSRVEPGIASAPQVPFASGPP